MAGGTPNPASSSMALLLPHLAIVIVALVSTTIPSVQAVLFQPSNPFPPLPLVNHNYDNLSYRAATRCGAFESTLVANVPGGQPVVSFLGLRFGGPLTPDNRWRPPPPAACSSPATLTKATEWGPTCVQIYEKEGTEDCLYLDVFVPEERAATLPEIYHASDGRVDEGELLPVIVYIHGGGLLEGSPRGLPLWDVAGADAEGTGGGPVVVVSIQYRLGLFGWLALEELSVEEEEEGGEGEEGGRYRSGNYGLLDQQLALKWVQEHIHAFGGDKSRVTVMGQSSGGTSVLALVSSPLSLDLFQGAISLSGSPNITMDLRTAQIQNAPLVSLLHCSADDGYPTRSSRLACLRALSTQILATSIPPSWGTPGMNGLPSSPHGQGYAGVMVVDGFLLPLPVQEALREGVVDVPLLLGNMAQEVDPWPANEVEALSTPEWQLFLRRWFRDRHFPSYHALAEGLFHLYRNETARDPQLAYDSIVSDLALTCGSLALASSAAMAQGRTSPVYVYLNRWAPEVPGPDPALTSEASSWIPRFERILGVTIVIFAICLLCGAAIGSRRAAKAATAEGPREEGGEGGEQDPNPSSVLPSPDTPSGRAPAGRAGKILSPMTSSPTKTPTTGGKKRRGLSREGRWAGWCLLGLACFGIALAVGMAVTDLFRPQRVVRYAFHSWDVVAWMRLYPDSAHPEAAAGNITGNAGLARVLRDSFYQFAAQGGKMNVTEQGGAKDGWWQAIDPGDTMTVTMSGNTSMPAESNTTEPLNITPSAVNDEDEGEEVVSYHPVVFVLQDEAQWPYETARSIPGYKRQVCDFLVADHDIDSRFWWAN